MNLLKEKVLTVSSMISGKRHSDQKMLFRCGLQIWILTLLILLYKSLQERLEHEIYGYTFRPQEYYLQLPVGLNADITGQVEKEWICFSPGIVPALNFCTLAFTRPGDSIIVQPPVYFPFFSAVESHGRKLIYNRLKEYDGKWVMDYDSLIAGIERETKMIIISNPHNPVGRVWTI